MNPLMLVTLRQSDGARCSATNPIQSPGPGRKEKQQEGAGGGHRSSSRGCTALLDCGARGSIARRSRERREGRGRRVGEARAQQQGLRWLGGGAGGAAAGLEILDLGDFPRGRRHGERRRPRSWTPASRCWGASAPRGGGCVAVRGDVGEGRMRRGRRADHRRSSSSAAHAERYWEGRIRRSDRAD
jgi:hypothetical protein